MTEPEKPMEENPERSDRERANRIRSYIYSLSAEVEAAKKAGLTVHLELGSLGLPGWVGFHDAAKISRRY